MTVLQIIWPSGRLLVPPRPREMFATIDRSFAGAPGSRQGSRRFSSKIQRCRDMANGRHGQQQSHPRSCRFYPGCAGLWLEATNVDAQVKSR